MIHDKRLKIFQIFHKKSDTIIDAPWVEPLTVGTYRNPHMGSTHTLDNINHLNEFYNELTALYWVWKNLNYHYVGFYHYRRVLNFIFDKTWSGEFGFSLKNSEQVRKYLGSPEQRECLGALLKVTPVVIPRLTASTKTTSDHYLHFHAKQPWEVYIKTLKEKFPQDADIIEIYNSSNLQTSFNMFVMERGVFNDYCLNLFEVIGMVFEKCQKINDPYNKRFPGFLAERFLHFWLIKESIPYTEVPVIMLD